MSREPNKARLEEQPVLKKPKLESEKEEVDMVAHRERCNKIWQEYNDQVEKSGGTKYELYRVVKVNVQPIDEPIYYITLLAEDLERANSGSGSDSLVKGPHGCLLVELQAKVFRSYPEKKMKYLYSHVKDNLSEEGHESHMQRVVYDLRHNNIE